MPSATKTENVRKIRRSGGSLVVVLTQELRRLGLVYGDDVRIVGSRDAITIRRLSQ